MGVACAIKLEMEFGTQGGGWTDVTQDMRAQIPIDVERGIVGSGPLDRVASTGRMRFALNNAANNSGGKEGYYSPGHVNARAGFDFGIRCRLTLTHKGQAVAISSSAIGNPGVVTTSVAHGLVSGEQADIASHTGSTPSINGSHVVTILSPTTFSIPVNITAGGTGGSVTLNNPKVRFLGKLDVIDPEAGSNRPRRTYCEVVDFMDDAARYPLDGLAAQISKRSDEVFSAVVAAMPAQPPAIEKDTGLDTFPYALDSTHDEETRALTEFQKIAVSELGYIYVKGDGTLTFESRKKRGQSSTNLQTFTNTMRDLGADRSRSAFLNKVRAIAHPRRVDADPTAVLYMLRNASEVGPSDEVTIFGPYRDPAQLADRVGGTAMQALVAVTDYQMNSAADGSGTDLTANFTVTASFGGNGVYFTIKNNGSQIGFITKLQCRGKGIYDFENAVAEAEDTSTHQTKGINPVNMDMPYQADPLVARSAAAYILQIYKDPVTNAETLTFQANKSDDLMRAALIREISDRVGIVESVTGLSTATQGTATRGFFINGIRYRITEGPWIVCTFTLTPADRNAYWRLGIAGSSELGDTTRLGYGIFQGHIDTPHQDSAHIDDAHVDTAHTDSAHQDQAHGDAGHDDVAHSDVAHTDVAHSDVAHSDVAHGDIAHVDSNTHDDVAHGDVGHGDHTDHIDHTDVGHADTTPHGDVPHDDVAHADSNTHNDTAHSDAAHSDVAHSDTAHNDVAHADTPHADAGHADTGHSDVAHGDTAHVDTPHGDQSHQDVSHGDAFQ